MTHGALVGEVVALPHAAAHVVLFEYGDVSVNLCHALLADIDVHHLQFADELLVFGKEKRQLRLLDGDGDIGADDV